MCKKLFAWLFPKPPVIMPEPIPEGSKKIALLFGINDYEGSASDLSGCLNDIDDVEEKLITEFSGYVIRKFKDSQVTCDRFYNEIKNVLVNSKAGDFIILWYSGHGTQLQSNHEIDGYDEALYLYDGAFTDDRMMELQQMTPTGVVFNSNLDSCFSGGMAKGFCLQPTYKNRFHQMPGVPILSKRVVSISKLSSKWVFNVFCDEGQTSADAWFNNRANGAGTFFFLKCFTLGTMFKAAMIKLQTYLPGNGFNQAPKLLGDGSLFEETYK